MNRKRMFTIIFVGIIAIAITASASWAGSRGRHQLEGFAIGVGALLLTKAIIDHHHDTVVVAPTTHKHRHRRPHHKPSGYWEVRKEWVPAIHKKVWNPGHYNRRGIWVGGRWIKVETHPGHWTKRRIWVPYH